MAGWRYGRRRHDNLQNTVFPEVYDGRRAVWTTFSSIIALELYFHSAYFGHIWAPRPPRWVAGSIGNSRVIVFFPSAPSSSSEQSWFQHVGIPQISDSFITGRSRCDSKQPTEDISPAGSQHQSIRYNIHNSPVPRTQIDLNLLPPSKTPSHQAAKSMQHGRHAHVSFPDISSSCNLCPPESLASLSLTTCQRTRGQP